MARKLKAAESKRAKKAILASLKRGASRRAAAAAAGVSHTTFAEWCKKDPEFSAECDRLTGLAVQTVEDSLFKACNTPSKQGKYDIAAITLYLTNRASDSWKSTSRTELAGADSSALPLPTVLEMLDKTKKAVASRRAEEGREA